MCGINGFISDQYSGEQRETIVRKMNSRLAHRGPDNDGIWSEHQLSFGHRRLSIIDLSAESNQPFFSGDGRYAVVYNGELYNYKELKLELQRNAQGSSSLPYFFKTASDTEVVLAAFIRWGAKCLDYFNGMYAFAIYDRQEKKLFIARDRIGVKPLYYYYGKEGLVFSSEIRPILHSGIRKFILNKECLAEYLMYQTVLAPNTIVKGVHMLLPGHYMELADDKLNLVQYYSLEKINQSAAGMSYAEVCGKTNELLTAAVHRRLVADVPFGAFLSGGIDSSAVVGLMSKVSSEKIRTFNVSFDESEFSESVYARAIAKKFNTEHHEIQLRPQDFLEQLPEALQAMDHPSGDGPNTYIVSKATKQAGVTMALSGIGGDELFAGYDVFKRMAELRRKSWLNALPRVTRQMGGYLMEKRQSTVATKKIRELLSLPEINFLSAYPLSRSLFTHKELMQLLPGADPFQQIRQIVRRSPQQEDHLLSAVSVSEINTYLQNTLLRDTDQMSMAVALEVREPFLDYKLIEFALSIPDEHKYPHRPKQVLVDSLKDLLPDEIVNRPKMGFVLPWKHWMQDELKDFCDTNLRQFAERGLVDSAKLLSLWTRFLAGDATVTWSRVWHVIVLNNWMNKNGIES